MSRKLKSFNKINFVNVRLFSICVALVCQFKTYETKSSVSGTLETLEANGDRGLPFLAALYRTDQSKFFCGATLISSLHLLTAAHCVREKYSNRTLEPDSVIVLLGAYDLTTNIEVGVRQREVKEIQVHPDWNVNSDNYNANIAILLLSESVTFTKYIEPVCMPDIDVIIDGASGYTVGWESNNTEVDNDTLIYSVETTRASYCLATHALPIFSSSHTFCGRSDDEISNKVMSGSGFFIRSGAIWMQYGIVQAIPFNETSDSSSIYFYTNVKEFSKWISKTVRKAGVRVMTMDELTKVKINFDCVYMDQPPNSELYECWVFDVKVQSENMEVSSVTGNHLNDYINTDVLWIRLINGTMFYIPDGIGKLFKNLQGIFVGSESNSHSSLDILRRF